MNMKRIIISALTALLLCFQLNAQTTLPTAWDFGNPGITSPPNGWTLNLGTNGALTYSSGVGDAVSCRLDATGENVVIWFADKPGPLSYYIKGTGISSPYFSGAFTVQEGPDTSHWSDMRTFTSMTNAFARFTDYPQPTSRYVRFFYTTKVSGSNVALDSVWLQAAPASPNASMNVKQNGVSLVNGNTYVIGNTASTLFTIENKGTLQALSIGTKNITGTNASDYSIPYFPSSVAASSSDTFRINFIAGANGSRLAQLSFANGDSSKNPFIIKLYGIGGTYATEPTQQPINLTFTNLKAYTFIVNYRNPVNAPEKFIVLRKKASVITEVPLDGHTYTRGDYIGAAQVAYVGSDTSFVQNNIVANTNYSFSIFAFNGPAGFENYLTTAPLNGNITSGGSNIGNYYSGINPASATFINDVHTKINVRDTVFYSNYAPTIINNFIARDTTGGKKVVSCVYTSLIYFYDDPFLWWNGSNSGTLTREHTYAQSWMPSKVGNANWPYDAATNSHELPEYNDQHHLFPADQTAANGKRSNYGFGEIVGTPTYVSPTGSGKLGLDSSGNTVWEPRNEHKGDLARALFYMAVMYNGVNGKNWSLGANTPQKEAILKKWHFQDPPDAWEIARHEYVNSIQHNRNPFIDSIYWVNKINFTNLTLITTVVPGVTLTSPIGTENWYSNHPYNITWQSSNIDSVKIDLLLNDTVFTTLAPKIASVGSFNWTISPISLASTKAKIRVTDIKSAATSQSANYFTISTSTGIFENRLSDNVSVYPNPSNGNVLVNIEKQQTGNAILHIFDMTGRMLQTIESKDNSIPVSLAVKGLYIIQISVNGETTFRKVVIE